VLASTSTRLDGARMLPLASPNGNDPSAQWPIGECGGSEHCALMSVSKRVCASPQRVRGPATSPAFVVLTCVPQRPLATQCWQYPRAAPTAIWPPSLCAFYLEVMDTTACRRLGCSHGIVCTRNQATAAMPSQSELSWMRRGGLSAKTNQSWHSRGERAVQPAALTKWRSHAWEAWCNASRSPPPPSLIVRSGCMRRAPPASIFMANASSAKCCSLTV
jgi:hypothetical protein